MNKLSSPIKLIEKSFGIFFDQKNLIYFLSVYLILVPFHVFTYLQSYLVDSNGMAKYSWSIWLILVVNLLFFVLYFLTLIMSIEGMGKFVRNVRISFGEAMSAAWKKLAKIMLIVVLTFLAGAVGTILLIIPGIIVGIWLSQATFLGVDRDLGVKEALIKSKELVKGRFWAVLGRLIVFGLFTLVCEIGLTLIPYGIGGIATTLLAGLFMLPSFLLFKELSA